MKKRILILVLAVLLCIPVFAACDKEEPLSEEEKAIAGYSYVCSNLLIMKKQLFQISLLSDRTFRYSTSYASSYVGYGEWEEKDGVLILHESTEGEEKRTFRFEIDGSTLKYIKAESDAFPHTELADGEAFVVLQNLEGDTTAK